MILFQFPLHWGGFPAILKSWFDRLWISGFTHTFQENFETGLLKVSHEMPSITMEYKGVKEFNFLVSLVLLDGSLLALPHDLHTFVIPVLFEEKPRI